MGAFFCFPTEFGNINQSPSRYRLEKKHGGIYNEQRKQTNQTQLPADRDRWQHIPFGWNRGENDVV